MVFKPSTWVKLSGIAAGAALALSAQAGGTYAQVYSFPHPTDTSASSPGSWPIWELTRDPASSAMYGVTSIGGSGGGGTLYDAGAQVLHRFGARGDVGGSKPNGPVLLAGSALYGVTEFGGTNGKGVLYKWSHAAGYQVQYHFGVGTGAAEPSGPLLLASNGNVYGTTRYGGTCGQGTVFQFPLTNPANVSVTHSFCGGDGSTPMTGVIQANDGKFYGTAYGGGDFQRGTLFRIDPATGAFTRLHSFGSTNFAPQLPSRLMQARDGLLYGTSYRGGDISGQSGTVFSSTLTGDVTVRASMAFTQAVNPSPRAALTERFINVFYGVSHGMSSGTVFQFRSTNNTVSLIHTFDPSTTGGWPWGGLTLGPDGNLWGVTSDGESTAWGQYGKVFLIQWLTANP